MGFELAALDLDGTLVDSAPDLCHCLGDALDSFGFERPGLADTRRWIGDGVELLVSRALASRLGRAPDADELGAALDVFRRSYRDNLFVSTIVYPGVGQTLESLAQHGVRLGCVTNKPGAFAVDVLEHAGLGHFMDFVYGADTHAARKPDPLPLIRAAEQVSVDPASAIMVGDSANDLKAALGAGFRFVFARYGYADPNDSSLQGGWATIDAFDELEQLLSR